MKRIPQMLVVLGLLLLLAACGGAVEEGGVEFGDPQAGRMIFETGGASQVPCVACHALDGTTLVGPSLQGISQRAGTRISGLSAEEYLRQSIIDPSAYLVEGFDDLMNKDYGEKLSEEDINNLIAFLMTQ